MRKFDKPQPGSIEAFIQALEDYYQAEYPQAQYDKLYEYLGGTSRSYRQILYKTITDRFSTREAAFLTTKIPDVAYMRSIAIDVSERHDLLLADHARLDRLALPDTDDIIDCAGLAQEAGIDTSREGWMAEYLFRRVREEKRRKSEK